MDTVTAGTIQQVWMLTLGIYFAVVAVVAVLLTLIVREAWRIEGGVAAIWETGQRIANNTIQIALLATTNRLAGRILQSAEGIVGATRAIRAHAEECPECPTCVLGSRWAR